MAGPIAHIFCALAVLQAGALQVTDQKAFILGSCYPDIDYIGVVKRETTHHPTVRWQDVVTAPTDFQKGLLLHSLVDEVRSAQLEKTQRIPALPIMRSQLMKFYEDSVLYSKISSWPSILGHFDSVIPDEQLHNVPATALATWHQFLKAYCQQQPSPVSTHAIINQFPQLRARIPVGIPSLLSKIYVGIAFRVFKRRHLDAAIHQFYDNCIALITSDAHLTHKVALGVIA